MKNRSTIRQALLLCAGTSAVFLTNPLSAYAEEDNEKVIKRITIFESGKESEGESSTKTTSEGHLCAGRKKYSFYGETRDGRTELIITEKPVDEFKGHWAGLDLGFTNFFSSAFDTSLPDNGRFMDLRVGKSAYVGLNLIQHCIGLGGSNDNIGIVTGLGLTFNNYRLASDYLLIRDQDGNTSYKESDREIKKSKLTSTYLTVPLLLETQFPGNNRDFFVSGGVYGAFRLGSHTKVVYDDGDSKEKEKFRDDLNLNSFKYGLTVRTGYKWIKMFFNYDLTPLFQKGQGPELYPWNVGIALINY